MNQLIFQPKDTLAMGEPGDPAAHEAALGLINHDAQGRRNQWSANGQGSKACSAFQLDCATMKLSDDHYEWAAQENRRSPHVPIALRALLRPEGEQSFATSVIDLSLGGFAAWAGDLLPSQSVCWLTFPGLEPLRAEVVWRHDKFVGCAFSDRLAPAVHDRITKRRGTG